MADKKISQLTASTTPLAGTEVLPIVQSGSTVKVAVSDLTAGRAVSASSVTASTGNLTFSSTGQRILADMSTSTIANRFAFQTTTVNANTNLHIIPNGSATQSGFKAETDSTFTTGQLLSIDIVGGSDARFNSSIRGAGTFVPITFWTGGAEKMRISTAGDLLVGAATTAGAATNVTFVTGGIFSTANGSAASTSAVAATLFAVNGTDNEVYIVSAAVPGGAPALYVTVYLVTCGNGTLSATALQTATNISISVSGLNVQSTQISGAPQNIAWKALRVA